MHTVHVSVRHLVEFMLRSGSIDAGFFASGAGKNRALEGTRVHQRIQRLRKREAESEGGSYRREVSLHTEIEYKDICFRLEGRADGIFSIDGADTIEEIKSTLLPLSLLEKDTSHWHWAQAKCYAYIYALSQGIQEISVSVIYGHIETEAHITLSETFSLQDLEFFVLGLVSRYWDFAKLEADCAAEYKSTGAALTFPYGDYRTGQRELAVAVYAAVQNKKKLFAQAPTGIGKTMATLFSAVKALSGGMGEKIFYITSKVVQRHLAEDALCQMQGLVMRSITLTAKDAICFQETRLCNPENCAYADGHFDRINAAILDCIRNETIITRAIAEAYARKHRVCPSEYVLDLSLFCQLIICDYNHVYDPKAKLRRYFQDGGDFILLQDEAHNLVDRGREMFSAGIHRNAFAKLRKMLKKGHALYKISGVAAKKIREHSAHAAPQDASLAPEELRLALGEFAAACEIWFKENPMQNAEEILQVYFSALDYLRVADLYDERYTAYKEPDYVRLFCLDPSYLLRQEQKKSRACIFFSATLTPLSYFHGILGGDDDDYLLRLGSAFPRKNLCLVVESRISTKYKLRDQSLEAIAERLYEMVQAKPGNYLAFFPSYAYLTQVYELFMDSYKDTDVEVIRQHQGEGNDRDFLAHFTDGDSHLLGFAVLGGVFSEGIDLKGERLIGAAVIGVGMPLISQARDIISNYFTANGKNGFDYAYIYPGMNKVLQAAGRVIRTEQDCGVVLLIDSRFAERHYTQLFPPEWAGYVNLNDRCKPEDVYTAFWKRHSHPYVALLSNADSIKI